jgi:hypothetical protein
MADGFFCGCRPPDRHSIAECEKITLLKISTTRVTVFVTFKKQQQAIINC